MVEDVSKIKPKTNPKADEASTNDKVEQELYAKRKKIYVREVHGLFAALRTMGVAALLGMYYIVPWLQWDERQAVLFDFPERKFYILNMVFWHISKNTDASPHGCFRHRSSTFARGRSAT